MQKDDRLSQKHDFWGEKLPHNYFHMITGVTCAPCVSDVVSGSGLDGC